MKTNHIESLTCWTFSDEYGKPSDVKRKFYHVRFDDLGRAHETVIFTSQDEKLASYFFQDYDSLGFLARTRFYRWQDGGDIFSDLRFTYDSDGHLVTVRNLDEAGEPLCRWDYRLNANGQPASIWIVNSVPSDFRFLEEYHYDSEGNTTEESWSFPNGNVKSWKYNYVFDERKRLKEKTKFNADGSLDFHKEYRYDQRGLLVEKIISQPDIFTQPVRRLFEYQQHARSH